MHLRPDIPIPTLTARNKLKHAVLDKQSKRIAANTAEEFSNLKEQQSQTTERGLQADQMKKRKIKASAVMAQKKAEQGVETTQT